MYTNQRFFNIHSIIISTFFTLGLLLLNYGFTIGQPAGSEEEIEWELQTNKNGVAVYTRWVPLPDGRETRELKGIVTIDAPVAQVVDQIRGEQMGKWLDRAEKLYHFQVTADRLRWHTYTEFNLPWPFSNQDQVMASRLKWNDGRTRAHISAHTVEGIIPEKDGIKRMKEFYTDWELTRLSNGQTLVDYRVITKAPPALPTWMSDPVVRQSTVNTLSALRASATKEK